MTAYTVEYHADTSDVGDGACAGGTYRSNHCIEYSVPGLGNYPQAQRSNQPEGTLPLDDRILFLPVSWSWLCRCTVINRRAAARNATGAVYVQRRRGNRAVAVHRCGCQLDGAVAALATTVCTTRCLTRVAIQHW